MILILLLNIVTGIVDSLFSAIAHVLLEFGIGADILDQIMINFLTFVQKGGSMFYFLFGSVATFLVAYIIGFQVLKHTWDIIWWVIRKIPMLNIRE